MTKRNPKTTRSLKVAVLKKLDYRLSDESPDRMHLDVTLDISVDEFLLIAKQVYEARSEYVSSPGVKNFIEQKNKEN